MVDLEAVKNAAKSAQDHKVRVLLDPQTVLRMVAVCEAAQAYVAAIPAGYSPSGFSVKVLRETVRALDE